MKMVKTLPEFEYFTVFLNNRNFFSKMRIFKVTDYAAISRGPILQVDMHLVEGSGPADLLFENRKCHLFLNNIWWVQVLQEIWKCTVVQNPLQYFLNGYTIFELKETRGAPHLALGTCAFVYFLFVFARAQRSSYGHCGLRAKWSLEVNTDLW